ncbi:hypothetical protein SRS16CHR_05035 [Variovorax sp. SRS16]|uniref:hypothetical protein n=1 Tax=Variovorax sp. SRS16 TaxID=282217 RepID=UPI001316DE44|nr:hypothetical protein [Variovorax sp. SRS16]VTU32187.1 hypothetical protein SRS16CHR_05035 [Variovorax sp. SRS16]
MKKHAVLVTLTLLSTFSAWAQRDAYVYENDRRYCASGSSGVDFDRCMRRLRHDRERNERDRYEQREYDGRRQWAQPPAPPPPRQWEGPPPAERPRLSDMQQRALDNCAMLAPRDQPRCRATVMSTVR